MTRSIRQWPGRTLLSAGLAAALAGAASAQLVDTIEGRLAAQALQQIAAEDGVVVDMLDDTDANIELQRALVEALSASGRAAVAAPEESGAIVLEFAASEIIGTTGRAGALGEIRVDTVHDLVEMRMNLWSSTRDALITGRGGADLRSTRLLQLDLVARRRIDGRVVWHARAYCEGRGGDATLLFARMAPVLVGHFGETSGVVAFTLVR